MHDGPVLHGSATTTEAQGVNPETVAKWKGRNRTLLY
jgi:hypothetical protein